MLKSDTGVTVSSKNGRPMHEFKFELTFTSLALRVSKLVGGKRVVTWMNQNYPHKSNYSGLVMLKIAPGHEKAHLANLRGTAQGECSFPLGLGVSVFCNQSESGGRELKATDGVNDDISDA